MNFHDTSTNIATLKEIVATIVTDRDWQQFHSPKNLAMKLCTESAELLEKFVWISTQESFAETNINRQEIEDETADVLFVLLAFCNAAHIDISSAMIRKAEEIKAKYPIEKAKGISTKYNKL